MRQARIDSRILRPRVRCSRSPGERSRLRASCWVMVRDGTPPGQNLAAAQIDPEGTHDSGEINAWVIVEGCIFRRDGGLAKGQRDFSQGNVAVLASLGIHDLVEEPSVPVEYLSGGRQNMIVESIQRRQVRQQMTCSKERCPDHKEQGQEDEGFSIGEHRAKPFLQEFRSSPYKTQIMAVRFRAR